MVHTNNPKVKEVLKELHETIVTKYKRENFKRKDILMENRIFSTFSSNYNISFSKCIMKINDKYNCDLTNDELVQIARNRRIANPIERKELFQWAEELAQYFEGAINGNKESFYKLEKHRRKPPFQNGKRHDSQERIAAIMIFTKYPEINIYDDATVLYSLNNVLAKYFFFDMVDAISNVYGFIPFKPQKKEQSKTAPARKMSYEEMSRRLMQLQNTLERTNTMLQDLQDDFEKQLEESKTKELTTFFIRLNSEKYGCILDELVMVRKGIDTLRKNNYELPIEINGLLIMVKKLIQFVIDSHIEPLMKINSIKEVTASDIEFCIYEGNPFVSENEVKKVKVVSPGWIYKDKEIQISRPKVREEK